MGRIIFLNQNSKTYHEQMGIKIKNPPDLKVIQGSKVDLAAPPKKDTKKVAKGKSGRKTMGQRIFESLQSSNPKNIR